MRVAVVMTGQPRSFDLIAAAQVKWLTSLRAHHQVDVFVHSWSAPASEAWQPHHLTALRAVGAVQETEPAFGPSDLFGAGQDPVEGGEGRPMNFNFMWASMNRAFAMVERSESETEPYDWVVRARPDVLWDVEAELFAAMRSGQPRLPRRLASRRTPSDLAAVLPRESAATYFAVLDHVPECRESYEAEGYRSFVAEFALDHYLRRSGFEWEQFSTDVALVRDRETWLWFPQDPWYFAGTASWALIAPDGDNVRGQPVPDLTKRARISLVDNGAASDAEAERLAPAVSATLSGDRPPTPAALDALLSAWRPAAVASPSELDVLLAGVLVRGLQRASWRGIRPIARRPLAAISWGVVCLRMALRRAARRRRHSRSWGGRDT